MFTIYEHIKNRYFSQRAQGMVEYALILALVVAVGIAVIKTGSDGELGKAITAAFNKVTGQINNIPSGSN